MKVGFIGAGGTGKTTVLGLLKDCGVPVMAGVSRGVFKERNLTEDSQLTMTPQEKWELQKEIFARKLQQDQIEDRISDRTLLDHFVYCLLRSTESIGDSTVTAYEALVRENLMKYDVLVYFPLAEFWSADDGFRQSHRAWALSVDSIARGLLEKLAIPYKMLPFGSPESRAALVKQWMEEAKTGEKKAAPLQEFADLNNLKAEFKKLSLKAGDLLVVRALGTQDQQNKVAQQVRLVKHQFGLDKVGMVVTDFSVAMGAISKEKLLEMGYQKAVR